MNEEIFNLQMRKFLKKVGITSQREIEKAATTVLFSEVEPIATRPRPWGMM